MPRSYEITDTMLDDPELFIQGCALRSITETQGDNTDIALAHETQLMADPMAMRETRLRFQNEERAAQCLGRQPAFRLTEQAALASMRDHIDQWRAVRNFHPGLATAGNPVHVPAAFGLLRLSGYSLDEQTFLAQRMERLFTTDSQQDFLDASDAIDLGLRYQERELARSDHQVAMPELRADF